MTSAATQSYLVLIRDKRGIQQTTFSTAHKILSCDSIIVTFNSCALMVNLSNVCRIHLQLWTEGRPAVRPNLHSGKHATLSTVANDDGSEVDTNNDAHCTILTIHTVPLSCSSLVSCRTAATDYDFWPTPESVTVLWSRISIRTQPLFQKDLRLS